MRTYELVLVVRPSLKDADRKKLVDNVKSWLTNVKFTKEEEWGQKPLAYPIKKEVSGNYYQWYFESEEGIKAEFEERIFRNDNIIRHLMLRTK